MCVRSAGVAALFRVMGPVRALRVTALGSVYAKGDALVPGLDAWLASLFDDDHLDATCTTLAGASEPNPEAQQREAQLRAGIAVRDRKIRNYRLLPDDQNTVTLGADWIAETQRERTGLERQLGEHLPGGRAHRQ
ncbi:MAG: hypothetical protein N2037_13620 [Acidimicrobiales bacterium]|nr:hypothetical protein [Acidimicrobiales bacterium]